MSADVAEELVFHCTDDRFFVEPVNSKQLLVIDRVSHEITLEENSGQIPFSASRKNVYGLVGVIHLIAGPYLILITKRIKVGTLNKQTIWRLADTEIVPYARSLVSLTAEQKLYNDKYLSMLQQVLSTPYFYFSYTYDLTHTLQRLYYTAEDFLQMALHERADVRFVWNQHLLRDLCVQPEMSAFCLPLVHGFISIKPSSINGEWFTWAIISRRSVYRAGTRMWTRGIDQEGAVANYVETEQIIEFRDFRSSFVQTRGSIPLYWSQEPNLKYKPPPRIGNANHEEAFTRHFESQVLCYGKQVAVNLIDQKGVEGKLHEAFKHLIETSASQMVRDNVRYEYFDFHHECRKMRWDRLSILMDRLAPDLDSMGYFLFRDGVVLLEQEGVFRTNCIDCLDRTNVVQSMLARKQLQSVLTRMAILIEKQKIQDQFSFESMFKNVWADNADIISTEYSGTGALKTDFTRTGKRTHMGMMKDLWNSGVRYIKNNFFDGDRQDALDMFLGKYQVEANEGATRLCPLNKNRDTRLLLLPSAFFFSLLMVFACILLPSEYSSFTLLSLLFWFGMMVVAFLATLMQGRLLVNSPRLCLSNLNHLTTPPRIG
ncbi:phosphatidylinositol-3-phosphatase SAC1 [Penaeus vannamei]|uniref:Phosphatidylinositol-3-phosphatase SAC1 n=1 Tax=Penaeus vannamei TaxID=6689 RepID=A0A423SER4_PENVA|nr:phosphatidylinositide phosphatase SAC1-like [Penaeus vannamei]XP_027233231.1 phosphatidylinositide phosphatase SAC1-like [Penaeus vannamei]ROT62709.1 Phosphatidylinositide phosphatase SAC1-B [Penaeus vannamei]